MDHPGDNLRPRTRHFALRLLRFLRTLHADPVTIELIRQLARSGPAIGANYRAACRGRSRKEFIAKLGTVVEEADETEFWLDILIELDALSTRESRWLFGESKELRAIFKASLDTARRNSMR